MTTAPPTHEPGLARRFFSTRRVVIGGWLMLGGVLLVRPDGPLWRSTEAQQEARAAAEGRDWTDGEPNLDLAEALLAKNDTAGTLASLAEAVDGCASPECVERYARLSDAAGNVAGALAGYERIAGPDNLDERVRLYLVAQRWRDAARALGDAPTPLTPRRRAMLAWALQSAGEGEEAISVYGSLADAGTLDPESALRYARLLNEQRRSDEASSLLDAWAGPGPDAAERTAGAAAAPAPTPADPAEALRFWQRRLDANPFDGAARAEAVALLERTERFEEAYELVLAGEMDPAAAGPQTLEHLARLRLWAGDDQGAARWYEAYARKVDPIPDSVAVDFASALLGSARPQDALLRLRDATSSAEPLPAALVVAARASAEVGMHAAAAASLERLGHRRGLTDDELRWLAALYLSAGQQARARGAFASLLSRDPDDPQALEGLGDLLWDAQEWAAAVDVLDRLVDEPGHPAAPKLARALVERGLVLQGSAVYDAYLDVHPNEDDVRLALARSLSAAGREGAAIPHYLRYARTGTAPVALEIARAYLAVADSASAETWAARARGSIADRESGR